MRMSYQKTYRWIRETFRSNSRARNVTLRRHQDDVICVETNLRAPLVRSEKYDALSSGSISQFPDFFFGAESPFDARVRT